MKDQALPEFPRDPALDSSLAFLREGYAFVSDRCDRLGSDVFETRITLRRVVCMRGKDAAGFFYGGGRFTRVGAMPRSVLHLLQDEGSVQTLDDDAHRGRKAMFMSLMSPDALAKMVELFRTELRDAVPRWQERERTVLHDALLDVLTRAVIAWAGIPLGESEVALRTDELGAMIENAGSIGPANWRARRLRNRSERWAREVIDRAAIGDLQPPAGSALAVLAAPAASGSARLETSVAAVELLNVLRPLVAVGRFMVFAALALQEHPVWRERFAAGSEEDLEPFAQEVRRFYPFFPVIGGRARETLDWQGYRFSKGLWVLLDLYGTNHDARLWPEPAAFRPERFRGWPGDPDTLVPQGAGAYETGHRCPGEWLTIALVKEAVRMLSAELRYDVPAQNFSISLSQMPALPKSGFVIANPRLAS